MVVADLRKQVRDIGRAKSLQVKQSATSASDSYQSTFGLSHCAAKYALAIANPWDGAAAGACVPRHPSRPSQKVCIFQRFQVTIGGITASAGARNAAIGCIFVAPSLAKDCPSLFILDNNVGLTEYPTSSQLQALMPFARPFSLNSPYVGANFAEITGSGSGPQAQGRIVSVGLNIATMNSTLYAGGTYTQFTTPNHDNVISYNAADLTGYDETYIGLIKYGKTESFVTSGVDESELVYNIANTNPTLGTANVTPNVYPFSNGQTLITQSIAPTSMFKGSVSSAYAAGGATITVNLTGVGGTTIPAAGSFSVLSNVYVDGVPTVYTFTYSSYSGTVSVGEVITFTLTAYGNNPALAIGIPISNGVGLVSSSNAAAAGCLPGGACMALYLKPFSTATSNVFQINYGQHVEYIGPITSALHTPTHSDARGFEIVSTATQRLPLARVSSPDVPLTKLMGRALKQVMLETAPVAIDSLARMSGPMGPLVQAGGRSILSRFMG